MSLLEARAVEFHRHGRAVFDAVDFTLDRGELLVLTGPNGSGKTTLLRVLAGILRPSRGQVACAGARGFVGHLPALKGDLSCRENLEFERSTGSADLGVSEALARVGLAGLGARPARSLSAGQRRRLGLARLLVRRHAIWLLDEPYASLDDEGCERVDELLHRQLERGAVILAAHQRKPAQAARFLALRSTPADVEAP